MAPEQEAFIVGLRRRVQEALGQHRSQHAIFLADILVSVSRGQRDDVYLLATAYFAARQYKRCLHVLKLHNLVKHRFPTVQPQQTSLADRGDMECVYLAAKCLEASGEWAECLDLLGDGEEIALNPTPEAYSSVHEATFSFQDEGAGEFLAAVYFLRGRCMEMVDRKSGALYCYRLALQTDPTYSEAFDRLHQAHLMDSGQEVEFIQSLRLPPGEEYLKLIYLARVKAVNGRSPTDGTADEVTCLEDSFGLRDNAQLKLVKAQREFTASNFHRAFGITSRMIHTEDPYSEDCMVLHICVLVELGKKTELFSLGHSLIDMTPTSALSWFCAGCYYYSIKSYDRAGKFFSKSANMDARFVPAWIAYGHTLSIVEESDQAMAAYRNAVRLCPGSHLGQLFIGMEHIRVGNLQLAEEFIRKSQHMCPNDPLVANELGVICYKLKRYEEAMRYFQHAMQLAPSALLGCNEHWEYPVFNLANTLRKLRKHDDALHYYHKSLSLRPNCYSTFAAIGFTHHLRGCVDEAIEYYHKALALKSNDTFCMEMLEKAFEEIASQGMSIDDRPDFTPRPLRGLAQVAALASPVPSALSPPLSLLPERFEAFGGLAAAGMANLRIPASSFPLSPCHFDLPPPDLSPFTLPSSSSAPGSSGSNLLPLSLGSSSATPPPQFARGSGWGGGSSVSTPHAPGSADLASATTFSFDGLPLQGHRLTHLQATPTFPFASAFTPTAGTGRRSNELLDSTTPVAMPPAHLGQPPLAPARRMPPREYLRRSDHSDASSARSSVGNQGVIRPLGLSPSPPPDDDEEMTDVPQAALPEPEVRPPPPVAHQSLQTPVRSAPGQRLSFSNLLDS